MNIIISAVEEAAVLSEIANVIGLPDVRINGQQSTAKTPGTLPGANEIAFASVFDYTEWDYDNDVKLVSSLRFFFRVKQGYVVFDVQEYFYAPIDRTYYEGPYPFKAHDILAAIYKTEGRVRGVKVEIAGDPNKVVENKSTLKSLSLKEIAESTRDYALFVRDLKRIIQRYDLRKPGLYGFKTIGDLGGTVAKLSSETKLGKFLSKNWAGGGPLFSV